MAGKSQFGSSSWKKYLVVVFLPQQAPTPMSGNIMYLPADRVRPLGISMMQAMSIVKAIGVGSARAFHQFLRPDITEHKPLSNKWKAFSSEVYIPAARRRRRQASIRGGAISCRCIGI